MKLTKEQNDIVTIGNDKDVFLGAVAGSGKTTVLAKRIAYLLNEQGVHPSEILVLTFTRKASQEMKSRILKYSNHQDISTMSIGTFHSVFVDILKDHGSVIDVNSVRYLKEYEMFAKIRSILKNQDVEVTDSMVYEFIEKIDRNKNYLIDPKKVLKSIKEEKEKSGHVPADRALFYKVYNESYNYFHKKNKYDFSDILLLVERILSTSQKVRDKYSNKWKYIIVDEAQDVNLAQIMILSHLKNDDNNIMCIGDFRQSIYQFRGSRPDFMLKHYRWFKGSILKNLSINFRSTSSIVESSNILISNSSSDLFREKAVPAIPHNKEGLPVKVVKTRSESAEAEYISSKIKSLMEKDNTKYGDIAVLATRHDMLSYIAGVLKENNIPYYIGSEKTFWNTQEVKRITGFYMMLDDPYNESYLYDIAINAGLKSSQVSKLVEYASDHGKSMIEALMSNNNKQTKKMRESLVTALEYCSKKEVLPSIKYIIETFDIVKHYKSKNSPKADKCIANISKMISLVKGNVENIDTKEDLVDYILEKLDTREVTKEANMVNLLTIHSSKGLEFPYVFVTGLEEGNIPDFRAITEEDIEEQRRLLYVAMTRAMEDLYLTYTRKRKVGEETRRVNSSRFLEEIGSYKSINLMKEGR